MKAAERRKAYDEGRNDVFAGSPIHEFEAAVESFDRPHQFSAECWCQPRVETVPARRLTHRAVDGI